MTHFPHPKTKAEMLNTLKHRLPIPGGHSPIIKSTMPMKNTLDYYLEDGTRKIRLHNTDILALWSNGKIVINTGGWNTVTTRRRINQYLPPPWGVSFRQGQLMLVNPRARWAHPFDQTVTIGPRGGVKCDRQ